MSEQAPHLRAVEESLEAPDAPSIAGITPPKQRGGSGRFLTDVLVELGFADADARPARDRGGKSRGRCRRSGCCSRSATITVRAALAGDRRALRPRPSRPRHVQGRHGAANLLSATAAKRYGAVPVTYLDDRTLLVAMSDPANVLAVDDIALLTRLDVKPAVASVEDITSLIARMNRFEDAVQEAVEEGEDGAAPLEIVDLRESAEDAPVIKLVHSIIAQAAEQGASDIHFEPQTDDSGRAGRELRVRMRIDGVLNEETTVPKRMVSGVVSRLKIMATSTSPSDAFPRTAASG